MLASYDHLKGDARINAMQAVIDRQQYRIMEFEAGLKPGVVPIKALGLTTFETATLGALMKAEPFLRYAAAWAVTPSRLEVCCEVLVRSRISAMRRKLRKHGVVIENVYGQGYRLSGDSKARLERLLGDS